MPDETNQTTPDESNTTPAQDAAPKPEGKKTKRAAKAVLEIKTESKPARLVQNFTDYDKLKLPKDESDPHWDPRMEMEVPEGLINAMVEDNETVSVLNVEEGPNDTYLFQDGRTRFRALPEVNKQRKKAGKAPFAFTLAVFPPTEDSIEGAKSILLRGMRANVRMDDPPTVFSLQCQRWLSADISEQEICATQGITAPTLHAYLGLLDLPKGVQKMVDDGTISRSAALALTKLDEGKVQAAADAMAAAVKAGQKVTAKDIARVAGADDKVATAKQKKQWILDLQSCKFAGKHGSVVNFAAIVAMEVAMGTRSIDQAMAALDRLGKGEGIKIDFKQYQDGSNGPVKGQS